MAEWIEVPAHRVLKINDREFKNDFEPLDENGNIVQIQGYASPIFYRRTRDEKLFRFPRYHRSSWDAEMTFFLEEV